MLYFARENMNSVDDVLGDTLYLLQEISSLALFLLRWIDSLFPHHLSDVLHESD